MLAWLAVARPPPASKPSASTLSRGRIPGADSGRYFKHGIALGIGFGRGQFLPYAMPGQGRRIGENVILKTLEAEQGRSLQEEARTLWPAAGLP